MIRNKKIEAVLEEILVNLDSVTINVGKTL